MTFWLNLYDTCCCGCDDEDDDGEFDLLERQHGRRRPKVDVSRDHLHRSFHSSGGGGASPTTMAVRSSGPRVSQTGTESESLRLGAESLERLRQIDVDDNYYLLYEVDESRRSSSTVLGNDKSADRLLASARSLLSSGGGDDEAGTGESPSVERVQEALRKYELAIRQSQNLDLKRVIVTEYEFQKSRVVEQLTPDERDMVQSFLEHARSPRHPLEARLIYYRKAETHTLDLGEKKLIRNESRRLVDSTRSRVELGAATHRVHLIASASTATATI